MHQIGAALLALAGAAVAVAATRPPRGPRPTLDALTDTEHPLPGDRL